MEKNEDTYVLFKKGLDLLVYGHMITLKTINKMGKEKEDKYEKK